MASAVAASLSIARSASTFCMSGWSTSLAPNARRCRAWWMAWVSAARTVAAEPRTQSSRVMLTISMIVGTPRPGSPTSHATVPSNSTSLEALDRSPSLSLSRCSRNALRSPSGSTRGTRKQEIPSSSCASTRNRSLIGALVNHLCPVSR